MTVGKSFNLLILAQYQTRNRHLVNSNQYAYYSYVSHGTVAGLLNIRASALSGKVRRERGGWEWAGQQETSTASNCNSSPWHFRHDHGACWLAECFSYLGGSQNIHHDSQTLGLGPGYPVRAKDVKGIYWQKHQTVAWAGLHGVQAWHHSCQISNLKAQICLWKGKFHFLR